MSFSSWAITCCSCVRAVGRAGVRSVMRTLRSRVLRVAVLAALACLAACEAQARTRDRWRRALYRGPGRRLRPGPRQQPHRAGRDRRPLRLFAGDQRLHVRTRAGGASNGSLVRLKATSAIQIMRPTLGRGELWTAGVQPPLGSVSAPPGRLRKRNASCVSARPSRRRTTLFPTHTTTSKSAIREEGDAQDIHAIELEATPAP